MKKRTFLFTLLIIMTQFSFAQQDPFLWLEEVENEKALDWVNQWNEKSLNVLMNQPDYQNIFDKNLRTSLDQL